MKLLFSSEHLIWIVSFSLFLGVIVVIFIAVNKIYSPYMDQYQPEKKRINEIFTLLDSIFWKDKNHSLCLAEEAVLISRRIKDSNALSQALYNKAKILRNFEVNDSVLIISNQALSIAERIPNDTLIAKIKQNIGNFYHSRDDYYLAMQNYSEVETIASKLRDNQLLGNASNGLGLISMALHDYDRAIILFANAVSFFSKEKRGGHWQMISPYINIGNCYIEKKEYYKAICYQKKGLKIAEQFHDKDMICKIYINLGLINQKFNSSLSLKYFSEAASYTIQCNNRRLYGIILQNLGIFYLEKNQKEKSESFIDQSLKIFKETNFRSAEMKANRVLMNIKKSQNQWEKAFFYYTRSIELKDSILNIQTQKQISNYQFEIESQRRKLEQQLLKKQIELQKNRNIILIITIAFILIIVFMLNRYLKKSIKLQKTENKHLQQISALEKVKYEAEMNAKSKELTTLSLQLVVKNEILTDIEDRVDKLYKGRMMNQTSYENLNHIIHEHFNEKKDWEQFKEMFEQIHQDFFLKLKNYCPDLTETELRLCSYLKINLSNNEIIRFFNINPGTLKTNRYHIRKKFKLDTSENLEDFLRRF